MTLPELLSLLRDIRSDLSAGRLPDAISKALPLIKYLLDQARGVVVFGESEEEKANKELIAVELRSMSNQLDSMATAANIGDGKLLDFFKFLIGVLVPIFVKA